LRSSRQGPIRRGFADPSQPTGRGVVISHKTGPSFTTNARSRPCRAPFFREGVPPFVMSPYRVVNDASAASKRCGKTSGDRYAGARIHRPPVETLHTPCIVAAAVLGFQTGLELLHVLHVHRHTHVYQQHVTPSVQGGVVRDPR